MNRMLLIILILIGITIGIGIVDATTAINVAEKELVIAGDAPYFYGVFTIANSADVYVTGFSSSLSKTLELFNQVNIGVINNVTETNGVISDWIS